MASTRKWSQLSLFSDLIKFLEQVAASSSDLFASMELSLALVMRTFKEIYALILIN